MKKPGSHGRYVRWLHMSLFALLAGQAFCDAPTSFDPLPTAAQTSVYYFLNIIVDVTGPIKEESEIEERLVQMFQNMLDSCVFPTTTSPQTTSARISNGTTLMTTAATTLKINTTTPTMSTTVNNTNTTTATMSTMVNNTKTTTATMSTMVNNTNTTTATMSTTVNNTKTTTATMSTMVNNTNTTTATMSTTVNNTNTTTATRSTTIETRTTATATTPTTIIKKTATTATTPTTIIRKTTKPTTIRKTTTTKRPVFGLVKQFRVPRQISGSETHTSRLHETTRLFQELELSCHGTTRNQKNCSLVVKLRKRVSPCCILRALCAATKTSPDIHVVAHRADRMSQLQNDCHGSEGDSCVYTGLTGPSCEESGAAYVESGINSTSCDRAPNNTCNCSTYCKKTDAYYTFQMSIQDPSINVSYILSLISKLHQTPNCSSSTSVSCPLAIIAAEYKVANVSCEIREELESCRVILHFANEVPICSVLAAVIKVFQSNKQISFDGTVSRAAKCGNSSMASEFTWSRTELKHTQFCADTEMSNVTCQNGKNVVVELNEKCVQGTFTTPSPNVTTTLPNTTVNITVTTVNATTTSEGAESQANALLDLTRDVSRLNSSQVDKLVSQLEDLLSGPTVSLALGNTSIHIVSNLLGASAETLAASSNRIIKIVDTVGLKLVLDEDAETLLTPAVALSVKPADGSNFQETFFSISDPSNVQVRDDSRQRRSVRADSSIPQGSIRLPPSLTQDLTSGEQQIASRVQFNFYQKSTVFQDVSMGSRKLNSGILGASVANLSITGLTDDVIIHLRNTEPIPANFVATCVFWDFTFNNESGGWNSNGCSVQNSTDNETVCGCNHLTSFAILLDLSREPVTNRLQATILTFITYIGCGISAIFLSITLLTYLAFGKLRKDIPSKILIQLCIALLLLNLVFLVDSWLALYPDAVGLCISTAWFLHYFLLVAFTWMGLEAVHMYLALVKVFNSYISHYMLKFSLVGWGIPMIVVIIVIAIDKDNYGLISYGRFTDGTSDEFCWLKNEIAFYVAVVAYFCVIFLFNFIMFILVLVQLCRIKRQNPHNMQHRSTLQDVRSMAGITILLGLTWGFAFFAWGPVNLPFMYLFAIFNSLQGFFIFVLYCALKENVRRQWRTYLCCGRMRLAENSEWSRTATHKTVKKSSVTRVTSLQSSKSNNSSSSTSFLVSDSLEQINGIGNPSDDRAITADEDPGMDVILNEINSQQRNQ